MYMLLCSAAVSTRAEEVSAPGSAPFLLPLLRLRPLSPASAQAPPLLLPLLRLRPFLLPLLRLRPLSPASAAADRDQTEKETHFWTFHKLIDDIVAGYWQELEHAVVNADPEHPKRSMGHMSSETDLYPDTIRAFGSSEARDQWQRETIHLAGQGRPIQERKVMPSKRSVTGQTWGVASVPCADHHLHHPPYQRSRNRNPNSLDNHISDSGIYPFCGNLQRRRRKTNLPKPLRVLKI
ncbi:hypothetical protein WMY93_018183 [Mugilogobius chulae]|uniref:Uncharacterized protein n=1 Tax=Mugilogobius chulae TaxID=88201 RepID=A0AAW0NMD6_9GOBI